MSGLDDAFVADVAGWDVGTWSPAIRYWDDVLAPLGPGLDALEVGAGPGGPSLWLAKAGHRVVCSNFDNTEQQARPLHERYGVAERIEYRDLDVVDLPYSNAFDVIVFKSVLGGITQRDAATQGRAVQQLHEALRPGGILLFAENLRGTPLHRAARSLAYSRRGVPKWRYITLRDLRGWLEPFRDVHVRTTGVLALFGRSERARRSLARADAAVFNRILPPSGHYVVYGSARKAD